MSNEKPWKLRNQIPSILSSGPMSSNDIAELTGRNRNAVRIVLVDMYEDGELHIADWKRSPRGHAIARFALGKGIDAEKPAPFTFAELSQRYRNTEHGKKVCLKSSRRWYRKNNGAGLKRIEKDNKRFMKLLETGGLKAIDPLLAAIMG